MLELPGCKTFESLLDQARILDHALVSCFVPSNHLSHHELRVVVFDEFFLGYRICKVNPSQDCFVFSLIIGRGEAQLYGLFDPLPNQGSKLKVLRPK